LNGGEKRKDIERGKNGRKGEVKGEIGEDQEDRFGGGEGKRNGRS
jgi:hypothetical protein